jgi:hypothetical protein
MPAIAIMIAQHTLPTAITPARNLATPLALAARLPWMAVLRAVALT